MWGVRHLLESYRKIQPVLPAPCSLLEKHQGREIRPRKLKPRGKGERGGVLIGCIETGHLF